MNYYLMTSERKIQQNNDCSNDVQTPAQYYINAIINLYGFTPRRLAKQLSVSENSINRIIQGAVKNPRVGTFNRLISLYYLLSEQKKL